MADSNGSTAFLDTPGGRHVAWFWSAIERGGEDVTHADLVQHFTDLGRRHPVLADDPQRLSVFARSAIGRARLTSVKPDGDREITVSLETHRGLLIDVRFDVSGSDGRIASFAPRLPGGGSFTALAMAGWRAAHFLLDEPRILDDAVAEAIAGEIGDGHIDAVRAHPTSHAGRFSVAARSRWAEDTLAESRGAGVDQYVLLGAGLDTFAYRRPNPDDGLHVFEVDRAASQVWKRQRLAEIGIAEPESVSYVSVDFESHDLDVQLTAAGFLSARPSVVAWLGVVYYLTSDAIEHTFSRIAKWAPGTRIVLDYGLPEHMWDSFGEPWNGDEMRSAVAALRAAGEPWLTYFEPHEIEALIRRHGYVDIEHLDYTGIRDRYLGGQTAPLPGPTPAMGLVRATVAGRSDRSMWER